MKEILKKYWKFILVFVVLNIGLLLFSSAYYGLSNRVRAKYLPFIIALQLLIEFICLFAYTKLKDKMKIEKLFLLLIIPLGLLHVFITPLNQIPDEQVHIIRAYEISNGNIIAPKDDDGKYRGELPKSAYDSMYHWEGDHKQYNRIAAGLLNWDDSEKVKKEYNITAGYHPIPYVTQVVGILIGKVLHLSPTMALYLGRITTLAMFIVLCYFAIKIIPKYKDVLLLFALLPETIQQGSSYNADALLIGSAFLFIAIALKYIYGDSKKIENKHIILLYVLGIAISTCKTLVYLPIFLILILIPYKKFGSKFKKYLHIILSFTIAFVVNMIWALTQNAITAGSGNTGYVLHNPIQFAVKIIGTMLGVNPLYLVESAYGERLSYGQVEAPIRIYVILALVMAVVLIVRNAEKLVIKEYERYIYFGVIIAVAVLLYTAAFTQWNFNKPADEVIAGIQGRYFIPLFPLIPYAAHTNGQFSKKPLDIEYVVMFVVFANALSIAVKLIYNL